MKLKIYIKRFDKEVDLPMIIHKGDWIDLRCAEPIKLKAPQASVRKTRTVEGVQESYRNVSFDIKLIKLGIGVLLPKGMEADIVVRSSIHKKGLMQANIFGVIDGGEQEYGYNGPTDEWKFPAYGISDVDIPKGERICQFRLHLSQKATMWQKLKWVFSNGIEIVEVDELPIDKTVNRNGFGEGTKDIDK